MDAWFETIERTHAAWTAAIEAAGLGGRYRALELGSWSAAAALSREDLEAFCAQPLPWDHIDTGVDKAWLAEDLRRAMAATVVPDCSFEGCSSCGVCGPELGHNVVVAPPAIPPQKPPQAPPAARAQRLRFGFARGRGLALLSHLDTLRLLERALRRSELPVSFSGGFHPMPRLQLALPLPLGAEGHREWLDLELAERLRPAAVLARLQAVLPEALRLLSVEEVAAGEPALSQRLEAAHWRLGLRPPAPDVAADPPRAAGPDEGDWRRAVAAVLANPTLVWHDTDKKGRPRQRDCRPYLRDLRLGPGPEGPDGRRWLELEAAIDPQGRSVRPEQVQRWLGDALGLPLDLVAMDRRRLVLRTC